MDGVVEGSSIKGGEGREWGVACGGGENLGFGEVEGEAMSGARALELAQEEGAVAEGEDDGGVVVVGRGGGAGAAAVIAAWRVVTFGACKAGVGAFVEFGDDGAEDCGQDDGGENGAEGASLREALGL